MNDKPEEDELVEFDSDAGNGKSQSPSKPKPPVK